MWGFQSEELRKILEKHRRGEDTNIPPAGEILVREPEVLEQRANRIYFYSEIDRASVLRLNAKMRDMQNDYLVEAKTYGMDMPKPIYLHVNSYGGSIFHGLAAMDAIISTKKDMNVFTVVDGCCASAATFLTVVGTKRFINPNAYMMIHQLSSVMWGKFDEFKDEMQNLERLMNTIKSIYLRYTQIPEAMLDEMLKHDLWFSAEDCLKYGLVDEIIDGS